MITVFNVILNMSITATLVALGLFALRLLFVKRLPAFFSYLLWGTLLFRLLVPFSFPAVFSVFGLAGKKSERTPIGEFSVTVVYIDPLEVQSVPPPDGTFRWWMIFSAIWLAGFTLLALYGIIGYAITLYKTRTAFIIRDNEIFARCQQLTGIEKRAVRLYQLDMFYSPVVLGIFKPGIYLPHRLDLANQRELKHILIHECVHIKRWDYITKALFYLALCLHWFNPFVWLCCALFDRDVEASCDERSLSLLGVDERRNYAESLIGMSSSRQSLFQKRLAFGESNLHHRVMNIIRYKPLSLFKTSLIMLAVVFVGLVTAANPLSVPDRFVPRAFPVSQANLQRFESAAKKLTDILSKGDATGLLALSSRSDPYYLPTYQWLAQTSIPVKNYKLYPQTDALAYCYLTAEDGSCYAAAFESGENGVFLSMLQPQTEFESIKSVDHDSEAVRFIRNLHRFGILENIAEPSSIPRPAVAMLCIDEVYRDKLKAGEIAADDIYLSPEWIAEAAMDYFQLNDFSYTFDRDLYDNSKQMYIYSSDRGRRFDAEVVSADEEGDSIVVTAYVYRDPLHTVTDRVITYTLQKRASVS